jgi:hypothetical protein
MGVNAAATGWSADGNWFWDGAQWNDAVSQDGKWRFDGSSWQPFGGGRTPMPAGTPAIAMPAPPAPPPSAAPAVAMPSWVAPSEVERIASEKRERAALAAQPVEPLPPELDWHRVGEHMDWSRSRRYYASWQVGVTSLLIYLGLLWFCGPLAIVFVWRTGWSLPRKIIASFFCFLSLLSLIRLYSRLRSTG